MLRMLVALSFAIAMAGAGLAQTNPMQPSPGEATQQIMPSSAMSPSPTTSIGANDDPFANGPVDQPFMAMSMDEMPRIVLFDRADFTGRRVGLIEDDADLTDHGFSAIASSARIHGGMWELCSEPNYAGACHRLSADTDLAAAGYGDTVKSVRLVNR